MDDQIVCPHCRKPIPLTQALSHQLQEKYKKIIQDDRKRQAELFERKLAEEKIKFEKDIREETVRKISSEIELKLKNQQNENEELKKRNSQLQEQLIELNRNLRQIRIQGEEQRLEMEKRLNDAQDKIREEEKKRLDEHYRLKILEIEKQKQDALKVNEELKRKLEQGSQQAQGEVLELVIEQILQKEFPLDEINPVPKGVRGADVIQIVKNSRGQICGTIIWESKRTKAWSDGWLLKLRDDQRAVKADLAVIVSEVLPAHIKHVGQSGGVWIGNYEAVTGLALALRHNLIELATAKLSLVNRKEKTEILYSYLTSNEFSQRVQAIIEAFSSIQEDMEKEKRWFNLKWAKEEKNIRKVIDNTHGMYGDLQSIIGNVLAEVKGMDLLPPEKEADPLLAVGDNKLF